MTKGGVLATTMGGPAAGNGVAGLNLPTMSGGSGVNGPGGSNAAA